MEYTDIGGIKIIYYISSDDEFNMDRLYGESTETYYLSAGRSKVVYEPTEEPTITNSFGITSEESLQFAEIPKSTFSRDITGCDYPKPGDAIKTLWNNRAYEVVDVSEETRIFQLKKLVYGFILKPFRFSEESNSAKEISPDLDSTLSAPSSAYGDNTFIEEQSDEIQNYGSVDESIYGY
jgi:hypothetical protein